MPCGSNDPTLLRDQWQERTGNREQVKREQGEKQNRVKRDMVKREQGQEGAGLSVSHASCEGNGKIMAPARETAAAIVFTGNTPAVHMYATIQTRNAMRMQVQALCDDMLNQHGMVCVTRASSSQPL